MPNSRPGEHPLTDILVYHKEIYGQEADDAIRSVADLSSRHELYQWWTDTIKGSTDRDLVLRKAQERFMELIQRSNQSGWGAIEE
jgi:hypothetical protein